MTSSSILVTIINMCGRQTSSYSNYKFIAHTYTMPPTLEESVDDHQSHNPESLKG